MFQNPEFHKFTVKRLVDYDHESNKKYSEYGVSILDIPVQGNLSDLISQGDVSLDDFKKFLFDEHGIENRNVIINFRPKKGVIFVVVESTKKDPVLNAIHRQLKASARNQLSGDRPGILCCYLAAVTKEVLLGPWNHQDEGTGLQFMVSNLIARRPEIHSVVFTTPGPVTNM